MAAPGRIQIFMLIACLAPAVPATASATTANVIGSPVAGKKTVRVPVLVAKRGVSGCARVHPGTARISRARLRTPAALRPGDRIRFTKRSFRVVRRSQAPSFARISRLISTTLTAGERAGRDVAAIVALPPDAAGQRNFASAEQARALAQQLNFLDEELARLATALDAGVGAVERAFGSDGRRCKAVRRARDRRTASLRRTADGARTASKALQAGVADIDRRLSFLPPVGIALPIGTVGTLTEVIQDLLDLLSGITGGGRP